MTNKTIGNLTAATTPLGGTEMLELQTSAPASARCTTKDVANLANPMTTAGDMVIGGASGAPTRLAKGTDGQVQTMVSGSPQWAAPPGTSVVSVAIQLAISDESTAITTGIAKITFRAPYAFTLTGVRASLSTASSSGLPTFAIKMGGTSILSTNLSINASAKTSVGATTPAVISTSAITDDAEITVDVTVAGTGATGAKITLIGTKP
jgi:hypothetical protein